MGMLSLNNKLIYGGADIFPTSGLLSYLRFEEASGNIVDAVGALTGVTENITYQQAGKKNYSLYFNGSNSRITFGNVYNFERTQPYSISIWVKRASVTTGAFTIMTNIVDGTPYRGSIDLYLSDNYLYFNNISTFTSNALIQVTTTTQLQDTNWHNIVATYDGTSKFSGKTLYVDGQSQSLTSSYAESLSQSTSSTGVLRIGQRIVGVQWWKGNLDEIGIWNRALTLREITALYNSGNGLFY